MEPGKTAILCEVAHTWSSKRSENWHRLPINRGVRRCRPMANQPVVIFADEGSSSTDERGGLRQSATKAMCTVTQRRRLVPRQPPSSINGQGSGEDIGRHLSPRIHNLPCIALSRCKNIRIPRTTSHSVVPRSLYPQNNQRFREFLDDPNCPDEARGGLDDQSAMSMTTKTSICLRCDSSCLAI